MSFDLHSGTEIDPTFHTSPSLTLLQYDKGFLAEVWLEMADHHPVMATNSGAPEVWGTRLNP